MTLIETRRDAGTRALPDFYDDLALSFGHAWAMLRRGADDRRSAFHTPVVATVDDAGAPAQRVMVLRAADEGRRGLRLHTDQRSAKLAHIARQPRVSLLFYDAAAKLQLRLSALARVHKDDAIAAEAWALSRPQGRLCYEQAEAPGVPVPGPLQGRPVGQRFAATDEGFTNFAVLLVEVEAIEWLYLAIEGHRRARWAWRDGDWKGTWLAP